MDTFKQLQRKRSISSTPATPTTSFLQPSRPFASLPTPASEQDALVTQAQLEHAARFGHSLQRISILPPAIDNAEMKKAEQVSAIDALDEAASTPISVQPESPSSSQAISNDVQANLERTTRFGHSFERISIFPPERLPMDARSTGNQQKGGIPDSSLETRLQKKDAPAETIRQAAQAGVRTPSRRLPYAEQIQQAFGRHDVSRIQAHMGPQATASVEAMQASAYTMGNHVVFAGSPSLPVVAHEAAHVMQQRAGVQPVNGIGNVGDVYEQHADAVAGRVVAGQSAQDLLDRVAPGRHEMAGTSHVSRNTLLASQHQPVVQRNGPGSGISGVTAPSLRAVETKNDHGAVGSFEYQKRWEVDHAVAGIIVQHVTREFHVSEVGRTHEMTGAEIDNYVTSPSSNAYGTVLEYWELWTVDATGKVDPVDEDTFGLCSIKPKGPRYRDTTFGSFTITGVANFYPTTTAPDVLGFALDAVETAGGLFSTTTNPTGRLGLATRPTITHKVKVEWNTETINKASPPQWKFVNGDSKVTSTYS